MTDCVHSESRLSSLYCAWSGPACYSGPCTSDGHRSSPSSSLCCANLKQPQVNPNADERLRTLRISHANVRACELCKPEPDPIDITGGRIHADTLTKGWTIEALPSYSEIVFRQFNGKWPLLESLTVALHKMDIAQVTALTEVDWPRLQTLCINPLTDAIPTLMKGNIGQSSRTCS